MTASNGLARRSDTSVSDGADRKTNPIAYKIEKRLVTRDSILPLYPAPGGGEAIRLKPATPEEQETLKAKS